MENRDLLDVIKVEVEARESSEGIRVNPQRNQTPNQGRTNHPNSTASSLFTSSGKVQSVYCGKDHFSASCDEVCTLMERKDKLLSSGRCFNCLKPNHKSQECNSPKSCRHCHKRHHQFICKVHVGNLSKSEQTTNTATNNVKGKSTILLQTAQAIATNNASHISKSVRVLFDNGSQRSLYH